MASDDLKRLRMRSWRRGMKEMDLILGPFSDTRLEGMSAQARADYEALLDENDQDLYAWILARMHGRAEAPRHLQAILDVIADEAQTRLRPKDTI